jgi:hypothetical protein
LKIVDPPPAILKDNFGMDATYILVFDTDFAVVGAADAKGAGESKAPPTGRSSPKAYLERRLRLFARVWH